ncbi:MAG: iron-containing alcohol dehydrogenase, partial [Deltaproteobacteria bacterium]|nr:iron-containing alcohol dehydrogenase [Deltaproteobacteria bacterium]
MSILPKIPKVHFDFGAIQALPGELEEIGIRRPLLVTDQGIVGCGVFDQLRSGISGLREFPVFDAIPENPTIEGVEKAYEHYQQEGCDGVVAIGGGSVIDSSKAVAVLAGHPGPISQYHRSPEKITTATAPIIALPTTAGTGSEVTRGAGIHPDAVTP